jgi:hypothetical protein
LAGRTGGLTGTKRVSLVLMVDAFDARKMASKRKMKISDIIGSCSLVQRPRLAAAITRRGKRPRVDREAKSWGDA